MDYTARQAAEAITAGLTTDGHQPTVHPDKVKTLVDANVFTNVSTTTRVMIEREQVEAFIEDTRYIYDLDELLNLNPLIYRVSVLPRRRSVAFDDFGDLLRDHSGVDYSINPQSQTALGGWEGVWPISEANAQELVDHEGLLLASCRGYVGRGYVRTVTGYSLSTARRYIHTTRPPSEVSDFVGSGILIDIPDGPISNFVRRRN